MKTSFRFLALSVLGILLSRTETAMGSSHQYFMADNVEVKIVDKSDPFHTHADVGFDRPCWARFLKVVEASEPQNPLHVEGSFKIVVGVILQEINSDHGCQAVIRENQSIVVNTNAPEGTFLGFEAIVSTAPKF